MNRKKQSFLISVMQLATPIVSVRIFYIAINFIGMLLIARLGEKELAASALVTVLANTIIVISMSPLLAIGIIGSRYFGSKQYEALGRLVRTGWLIATLIGLLAIYVMLHVHWVLDKFHQPQTIVPLVDAYFAGMSWGVLPLLLIAICHQLCFASKNARLVCWWSFFTFVFTLPLGALLTFGYWGFPKLGIAGWSYSISIINWFSSIVIAIYLFRANLFQQLQLFNFRSQPWSAELKNIMHIGSPIVLQLSAELIAFALANFMIGWIGLEALAVQQITLQFAMIVLMLPMGAAQACAILIGQAIGSERAQDVRKIVLAGMQLILSAMTIIVSLYFIFPYQLASMYVDTLELSPYMIKMIKLNFLIAGFSQSFDAVRNLLLGCLRGLQDVWLPMYLNIAIIFSAVILAYILAFSFNIGLCGINLAFMGLFMLGASLMYKRLHDNVSVSLKKTSLTY